MKVLFNGELRSVIVGKEFKRRNGDVDYSVDLTVEVDGKSFYLPCSKSVGELWTNGEIQKGVLYTFKADYRPNWKFNQFEVQSVVDVES